MEHAAVLFPRPAQGRDDYGGNVYLTARGGFGQYLGRGSTFSVRLPQQIKKESPLDFQWGLGQLVMANGRSMDSRPGTATAQPPETKEMPAIPEQNAEEQPK